MGYSLNLIGGASFHVIIESFFVRCGFEIRHRWFSSMSVFTAWL